MNTSTMLSPEFIKVRSEIQLQILGWPFAKGVEALAGLIESVKDEDFSGVYRDAWRVIKKQFLETNGIDVIELVQRVHAIPLGVYNKYGNMLSNMSDLKNAVRRLKESARVERILLAVDETRKKAESGDFEISQKLFDEVLSEELNTDGRWQSFGEVAAALISDKKRDIFHVRSKFSTLNELVYSYKSGDLHVIAARPGVGKTTFLLNEAVAIAKQGIPVGFITLEMPAQQCVRRVISMETGVEFKKLYDNGILMDTIVENEQKIDLPIHFYENYSLEWHQLLMKIRKIVQTGVRVVFIDQLSHIKHDTRSYSKADAIEKTVRALRSLALELNIIIIMAVQINRNAMQSDTPELEHLKDSGSIEEASQLVVMLQRKDDSLKAYVRKATHGRLGEFTLNFFAETCAFNEGEEVTLSDF